MTTLREWFLKPRTTLQESYDRGVTVTPGNMSSHLMADQEVNSIPPPALLIDLGMFDTPYTVVWNRPANRISR